MDGCEHGGQCSWTETFHDQRNSNLCDSEIQENTHVSEVGERKEYRLRNDNLEQNNRMGEVIAQCYSMVKILHAEPGYTGLNSWVKSLDKGERESRYEIRTKNIGVKISTTGNK